MSWCELVQEFETADALGRSSGVVLWYGPLLVWHGPYHDAVVLDAVAECALFAECAHSFVMLRRLREQLA